MDKKNILKSVLIGGLVLSVPFAVFAQNNVNTDIDSNKFIRQKGFAFSQGDLLDEPSIDENCIERLDMKIEQKIEEAKYLIEKLSEKDADIYIDRLNEIVEEFAELDAELDLLDVEETMADELKEIFFETREDATELTTEFRELITDVFSEEEKVELRAKLQEQFRVNKHMNLQQGVPFPMNPEVIAIIDEDIAEQLENEEITIQEAHDLIKEKIDALTDEELEELRSEISEVMPYEPKGMRGGNFKRATQED